MFILIFILILISLGGGGYLGYKIGVRFMKQENMLLQRQMALLERFSQHWAEEATDKNELSQKVAHQYSLNVANAMQSTIQLLRSIQMQKDNSLSTEDKQKVENIINQAKQITPFEYHEINNE